MTKPTIDIEVEKDERGNPLPPVQTDALLIMREFDDPENPSPNATHVKERHRVSSDSYVLQNELRGIAQQVAMLIQAIHELTMAQYQANANFQKIVKHLLPTEEEVENHKRIVPAMVIGKGGFN